MELISPLPYYPGTKDVRRHPIFRSPLARWGWRIYTQRLTRAGRWFFWPSFIFLGYGAASVETQGFVPLFYIAALWVVAWIVGWWLRPRVKLVVRLADRVAAGTDLPVEVTVSTDNRGRRSTAVDLFALPDRLPPEIDAVPEDGVILPETQPGILVRARLYLRCKRRGVYSMGGFRVETDAPFGIWRTARVFNQKHQIVVHPEFRPLAEVRIPVGRKYQPGGAAYSSTLADSFEYVGSREYQSGDNVRHIDWRATARLSRPIVREYREEYFLRTAVVLDTHIPAAKRSRQRQHGRSLRRGRREKVTPEGERSFEAGVSLCAAVSDCLVRQDYLVDILALGTELYHFQLGRGRGCLDQILDLLAEVEHTSEEGLDRLEARLMECLEQITSVVCIFLDWTERQRSFVDRLAQHGTGVKVIVVRSGPCDLPTGDASSPFAVRQITPEELDGQVDFL